MSRNQTVEAPIDKKIFWPACIIIISAIVSLIAFEDGAQAALKHIFNFATNQFGFVYTWAGAIFFPRFSE